MSKANSDKRAHTVILQKDFERGERALAVVLALPRKVAKKIREATPSHSRKRNGQNDGKR